MNPDSTILGKFKSVEALTQAYECLQKEFTKKCQKLSQLQSENCSITEQPTVFDGQGKTQQEDTDKGFPQTLPSKVRSADISDNPHSSSQTSATDPFLSNDDVLIEKLIDNDSLLDRLLDRYVQKISAANAPALIGGQGVFSLTPPKQPQTVSEAGKMAEKIFK